MIFREEISSFIVFSALFYCVSGVFAATIPAVSPGKEISVNVFDDPAVTRKSEKTGIYPLNTTQPVVNEELIFRFFENTIYTMRVSRVTSGYNGDVIVEGNDDTTPSSLFRQVFSSKGVRTELNDNIRGFLYQSIPRGGGTQLILEFDQRKGEKVTPTSPLTVPDDSLFNALGIQTLSATGDAETLSTETVIDVMLVFDQTAQTWANANGGITAFANATISKMNTAHALSGTECSFRLVHIYLSDYSYSSSSSLSAELSDMYYETGGFGDVSSLRDAVGADLAAALVDTGSAYGTTGIAYIPWSSSGYDGSAFSVCSIRAVNNGHTLTHEIGHNLGCGHPKNQTSGPGPGVFSYAAGWYFTGSNNTRYHTIMSYNYNNGTYYTPCGLFSSPLLSFMNTIAGNAADGDNARCIRQMKSVVAAYRVSATTPVGNPTVDSSSGSPFQESTEVTMSCSTSDAEIYYTTDGSTPDAGSLLYSGPITITGSTTFNVIAVKTGMDNSEVISATFDRALEVGACSISSDSGSKTFHLQFYAEAGQTYTLQCKESLSASIPWRDYDPPVSLTAGSDGTNQFNIDIPESGGNMFFKIIKE